MERIYFDNAATTPLDKEVADAMYQVMLHEYGNPSSTHATGRTVRTIIEECRRTIAKLINCSPGEIFFTSGGTEADNMAIRKTVEDFKIQNIITSAIEHHAVSHTIEELAHAGLVKMHLVKLTENGHIDYTDLESLLQNNPNALVSLMHANNEIGNLLDAERVGNLCEQYKAFFHSDTVQTIGHYPIDIQKLKVHFIACAAHKFHGPKGVGFIYVSSNAKIHPFITGGAQERNMRGGTENVYGIVGLTKALEKAYANLDEEMAHISSLKKYMIEQLKANIPGIQFNGDAEGNSLYTVLNTSFPPSPIGEMLLFKLDIAGVSVSGGSACSSGSDVGSHVLKALNADRNRAAVRFSFAKQNTKTEVDQVIAALVEMLNLPAKSN
ncbi:MAG: cysteine desulfurase [Bacteroidia bacterium]|nr:cysteine desulfurase [Bacteroidia bacterium]